MLALEGHQGTVYALAFAPDGDTFVSGAEGGVVRVWVPPVEHDALAAHSQRVLCLAFSADGTRLATGGADRFVHVWDPAARRLVHTVPAQPLAVTGVSFIPDDQTLLIATGDRSRVSGSARSLTLWDLAKGKERPAPAYETRGIRAMDALPARRLVAWITDQKTLRVCDMSRAGSPPPYVLKKEANAVAWSPNGHTVAVGVDQDVLLFDAERTPLRPSATLTGHAGRVNALAYSPDGRTLYSGSWDKTVKCWDAATGREKAAYAWPVGRVHSLAVAPDGLRAAAAGDAGVIFLWDIDT